MASSSVSQQRVVVGYDARPESEDALDLAVVLAEALEATLLIASIETRRGLFHRGAASEPVAPRRASILADAESRVRLGAPSLRVTTQITEARIPASGLRELCEAELASVLVVGSSERGGLGQIMLGNTVERLCRDSPCPLAIAPRGYRQRPAKELRIIAVAFDSAHEAAARLPRPSRSRNALRRPCGCSAS